LFFLHLELAPLRAAVVAMGANNEINVPRLLDQVETGIGRYDAVDLRNFVAAKDHEQVRVGTNAFVLEEVELERPLAVIVTALAEKLAGSVVTPSADDVRDPLVDFAQKHLGTNELFERSGHRVLLRRTVRRDT
jgi:hypothetical protein